MRRARKRARRKISLNQFVTRRSREVCAIEIVSGKLNNCQSNWWTRRRKIYFYLLLPDSPDDVGMWHLNSWASRFQFSTHRFGKLSLLVKCTDSITGAFPLDKLKYRSGHANYKFDVVLISATSHRFLRGKLVRDPSKRCNK